MAVETCPNSPVMSEKAQSEAAKVEVEENAKATLPPFYPFSPHSSGSGSDVQLKGPLTHVRMEAKMDRNVRLKWSCVTTSASSRLRLKHNL